MTYWGYRIDKWKIDFFRDELKQGRLRQGWGYKPGQDLRNLEQNNEGASRNKPMFDHVKKGDILLVPYLPEWEKVAIVRATEDWNEGYKFEDNTKHGDYGHIFPAEYLKSFVRKNQHVIGSIRSTLKYPGRFWCIHHDESIDNIKQLMEMKEEDLGTYQHPSDRLIGAVKNVFEGKFKKEIYDELNRQFTDIGWEHALVEGLSKLFPYYKVKHVGGHNEQNHGTDILIQMPSLLPGYPDYGIAIQVKDWEGVVSDYPIEQIKKADEYWKKDNNYNLKLIEKIVLITKAKRDDNPEIIKEKDDVKIIFAEDLKDLLSGIAKRLLVEKDTY